MKNLKRVLSLSLASVMLLGMMVVGASAKDFTDADEIEHVDAVQTLVALNVIKGMEDGSYFDPEGSVTRGEMAKMIAVAMNGGNEEAPGVKMTPTFTDIADHWAQPYIEYCYDMGIISGRGDGTFDPNGDVTGMEAAKMVLTALGYDDEAYELTGASWAVRTYEVAKTAKPDGLLEELDGVSLNAPATRDVAAQLIWNGLDSYVVTITPTTNRQDSGLEWDYSVDTTTKLLKQRYNAETIEGTYKGNAKCISTLADGEICVNDGSHDHNFPCDLGIENIGEEVRIVWKDGKRGTPNRADKNDTIYGCFNTGRSVVYNITKNDLQDAKTDKANHIKFGGDLYEAKSKVKVVTDYTNIDGVDTDAKDFTDDKSTLRIQSADTIKFVTDPDDGKIAYAYITNMKMGHVTSITGSKVTISGLGAIDIDDNDVEEDLEKDDVVVYTRFYNASELDKAFVTVKKAETVEGTFTGFKYEDGKYVNVVVDGETYKTNGKPAHIASETEEAMTDPADKNIGDEVAFYMVGDMVGAIQITSAKGGNYAVITDADVSSGTGGVSIGSDLKPARVTILMPDGSKETFAVHKDSTYTTNSASIITDSNMESCLTVGTLVEYSINGGKINIKQAVGHGAPVNSTTATAGIVNMSGVTGTTPVWNKTTKALATSVSGATIDGTAVAAADAVVFVSVCDDPSNPDDVDRWIAYNLRDLGNVLQSEMEKHPAEKSNPIIEYIKDAKTSQIKAAFLSMKGRPSNDTAETMHGMVKELIGTRKNDDKETLYEYTVAVNGEDGLLTVAVTSQVLTAGELVEFDESVTGEYDANDFTHINEVTVTNPTAKGYTVVAVNKYSNNILSYFTNTVKSGAVWAGDDTTSGSVTVSKDVKVVYINANDKKDGDETGVASFDTSTGFKNAVIHLDSDGVVDVIIMETSGKKGFTAGKVGASGTLTAGDSDSAADIKAKADGVYIPGAVGAGQAITDAGSDPALVRVFKYTSNGDSTNQYYWLVIKDKDGNVVYADCATNADSAGHYIYLTLKPVACGDNAGLKGSWGSQGSPAAVAPDGTYTWSIIQSAEGTTANYSSTMAGTTLVSGSFSWEDPA